MKHADQLNIHTKQQQFEIINRSQNVQRIYSNTSSADQNLIMSGMHKRPQKSIEKNDHLAMFANETSVCQNSRDQLLLLKNKIPLSVEKIVGTSSIQFNEILKKTQITSEQLTIVKDIRKRGKNKIAAQICRKRKIHSIESLRKDIEYLINRESTLEDEQEMLENQVSFKIRWSRVQE